MLNICLVSCFLCSYESAKHTIMASSQLEKKYGVPAHINMGMISPSERNTKFNSSEFFFYQFTMNCEAFQLFAKG